MLLHQSTIKRKSQLQKNKKQNQQHSNTGKRNTYSSEKVQRYPKIPKYERDHTKHLAVPSKNASL
jgi:hypothetical protein